MTERVTVEQNGERFTLDVPDGTSDEQIQQFLTTQSQAQPQAPVAPDNSNDMANMAAAAGAGAVGLNAPNIMQGTANAINNAGQMAQTGKSIVGPTFSGAAQSAGDLIKTYARNPGTAAADLAASHLGLPPPTAAAKAAPLYSGIQQTYQQAKNYINKTGQFAPTQTNTTANQISAEQAAQAAKENALNNALTEHTTKTPNPLKTASDLGGMNYDQKLQWAKTNGVKLPDTLATEAGAAEAFANPTTSNFMTRISSLAGKYIPAAMMAKELLYTSPEEIAILKQAEAQRRAQGWKPLNER